MAKKIIIAILFIFFLIPNMCYSSSKDIIYNILDNNNNSNVVTNTVILKAMNKDNQDIKIKLINNKKDIKKNKNTKHQQDYLAGVDISKWNGKIDWKAVKDANIDFVIIRAGYGTNYVDPFFKQNIKNAIKNNMMIGIYWFSYASNSQQAKFEADKCYKTIKPYKKYIELPVFWDFEYDSVEYAKKRGKRIDKKLCSNMADTFCTTIKNKGFRAGIYCNIDYSKKYFTQKVLKKYHTWIAQWSNVCTYKYNYIIWQCSDSYMIKGKKFDLNFLYHNKYIKEIKKISSRQPKKMKVIATAYSSDTITSTMTIPKWGVIAVDPKVIPYGSTVYIPVFDKNFIAEDCGGAIKGNRIDIFMQSEQKCINWGRREIEIQISY